MTKLLLDQNLSPRLQVDLADVFPGSVHVEQVGLDAVDDGEVWAYARRHGFTFASKDVDFRNRAIRNGPPPLVIWLRLGNCTTSTVAHVLRDAARGIDAAAPDTALLVLERRNH